MKRMAHPQFKCKVLVQVLPEQTQADQGVYAFSYTITIVNSGDITAQLVGRHWQITDAQGHVQRVDGLAVVGHQPLLAPGQQFQYSSWAQIGTPQGSMSGRFLCVTEDAEVFYAEVPEFLLADSGSLH
jgi:ApaG protein